ncbi:MAG TPA: CDP-alcohol phosphatidyltransferase family protein [Labilithrix sp.]|nr:CDP-alcohol phosphatidyltransferase family protein [Labilithrix sp.]
MTSLDSRRALAEHLTDFLNARYRYPASRALFRVASGLPLRPDHVTYLHTTIGLLGAALVAWGNRWALVAAFFLLEARMVLDCYDGVLARGKNLSSPRGRTIDELGDAVAYVAIVIGMSIHVHRARPDLPLAAVVVLAMVVMIAGAMSGHAYDFYKRLLGTALKDGRDSIADELEEKEALVRKGGAAWITRFGIWFDRWQVRLYAPAVRNDDRAAAVIAASGTFGMKLLVRQVALLSWDNVLALMSVAILLDRVLEVELLSIAYFVVMFTTARVMIWRVIGKRGAT